MPLFSKFTLEGQVVLITGAGAGIGKVVSHAFAEEGATVVLADLNKESIESLRDQLASAGSTAHAVQVDIGDPDSILSLFQWIKKEIGRLDTCVTCAGIISKTNLLDISLNEWNRIMNINLTGTFLCIQESYRLMLPQKSGNIIAIASDTAKRGGGRIGTAAYGSSKGGVLALVKSIAREMAGSGVRINTVCPGPVETPMHHSLDHTLREQVSASIPLGRFAKAEEIAHAIVFLSSDAASYIYGESMNVDGGVLME